MEITLDASELERFAEAMEMAPDTLQRELKDSSDVALHEGVGYAQENVPRQDGILAADIRVLDGPGPDGGSYGTDLVYAWQREEGGTIYPRNGEFLVFRLAEAVTPQNPEGLVFARQVTQEGSHYMEKSMEALEPRIEPIYQLAVDRTLELR